MFVFSGPSTAVGAPPLRCYTPTDGLSHTTVLSTYHDREGYLWFGAYEAVNRFNGVGFSDPLAPWDLTVSRVRRIVGGLDRDIWLATHGGALLLRPDQPPKKLTRANGLAGDSVYDIAVEPDGTCWFAADGGLTRLGPNGEARAYTIRDGLPHGEIRRILPADNGGYWIGTLGGLAFFDGQTIMPFKEDPLLARAAIYAMLLDRAGRLWLGTDDGLLCLGLDGIARRYDESHGLPDQNVWALCADRRGAIWLGTDAGVGYLETGTAPERAAPARKQSSDRDHRRHGPGHRSANPSESGEQPAWRGLLVPVSRHGEAIRHPARPRPRPCTLAWRTRQP